MNNTMLFCPDCSRQLPFSSAETNAIVCASCGNPVHRDPAGMLVVKPQFLITGDNDVLQPGTRGTWKQKPFTITGRFRAWFEDSLFNYWTIVNDDGTTNLLGEGYGIYEILTPAAEDHIIDDAIVRKIKEHDRKNFGLHNYVLHRKSDTSKIEVQGELLLPSLSGSFTLLEFASSEDYHLQVLAFDRNDIFVYHTAFARFDDFAFTGLKQTVPEKKEVTCFKCAQVIPLITYPYCRSFACGNCGQYYSLHGEPKQLRQKQSKVDEVPLFDIGSTGQIEGTTYQVVGFVTKEERNEYHSQWREYALYNNTRGFAFLSVYNGHWIFLREEPLSPVLENENETKFELDGEPFLLFNKYSYKILSARGEFPTDIFAAAEDTRAREYISPPEIWIWEKHPKLGTTWFFGRHFSAKELKQGFGTEYPPVREGVGAIQPTGFIQPVKYLVAAVIGILVLLVTHSVIGLAKKQREVFSRHTAFPDSLDRVQYVTPAFTLEQWRGNLQLQIDAPVLNEWFELGATLVNSSTGEEYSLEKGVEYYKGYTDGESWTEGSTHSNAYLSSIPEGTYFLQVDGIRGSRTVSGFDLTVVYDVPMERNALWPAGIFAAVLFGWYQLTNLQEKRRWSNSPFTPYQS